MSDASFANAGVAAFDALPEHEASALLQSCCGATAWVQGMIQHRPFGTLQRMLGEADDVWWSLTRDDWREAFDHHPRIGEQSASATQSSTAQVWSRDEQRGAISAAADARQALAEGNRQYERKFGRIYLVCATGKSAEELLAILRQRLAHDPESELRVAAGEQAKITQLRLEKLFNRTSTNVRA